jgi:hypothetical protein
MVMDKQCCLLKNMDDIINKVAESGLITLHLEDYYPKGERVLFDINDYLFQGLILKEKDFRTALQFSDWTEYQNKFVAIYCSSDAIIPLWAYMLVASYLEPFAKKIIFGNLNTLEAFLFQDELSKLDLESFRDQKVIVKGCGDLNIPEHAYVEITRLLKPFVKNLMFGEACSTVPIYKKK